MAMAGAEANLLFPGVAFGVVVAVLNGGVVGDDDDVAVAN
jgi:hypothetical protein